MNQILVIQPYKIGNTWMFDDPRVGLEGEPFVGNVNLMIDQMVSKFRHPEKGFLAMFSKEWFPKYDILLFHVREEQGGDWYYCPRYSCEGWLCPALRLYFPEAPEKIFVKAEPMEKKSLFKIILDALRFS